MCTYQLKSYEVTLPNCITLKLSESEKQNSNHGLSKQTYVFSKDFKQVKGIMQGEKGMDSISVVYGSWLSDSAERALFVQ